MIVVGAVLLVAYSLNRPAPQGYPPTPTRSAVTGDALLGPITYTIDASSPDAWRFFSFARGRVLAADDTAQWDLAFRRFRIIANGGVGFSDNAGIIDLGPVAFESVMEAPATGYVPSSAGKDSANAAIARWYDYGWTSHVLKPKPNVWVVRTADGRYAKLRLLSYYCPAAQPGCMTFRYVYHGKGGRAFRP